MKVCHRYVRVRTDEAINKFCDLLLKEQWEGVFKGEVNTAYDSSLKTYLSLYDKHRPVRQYKQKHYNNEKPWITKDLQNACKKENNHYRDFITFRTKNVERQ